MRIAVTGAAGLLGTTLVPSWREAGADVLAWPHRECDVTDPAAVRARVAQARADVVVHCAAWTDVDGAEAAPADALRVNRDGTAAVVAAAAAAGAALVHLSTDYVFDGTAATPIPPDAVPSPLGAYARSKAEAEEAVRNSPGEWLIARTGWMYGPGGRNFVDTMRRSAAGSQGVRVVDDQRGAPTSARLVADVLWRLVAAGRRGVWHLAAAGTTTWYEVARTVYQDAGADSALVTACNSAELGRPARRPAFAVLDCGKTERMLGRPLPPWRAAVGAYVKHGIAIGLEGRHKGGPYNASMRFGA